MLKTVCDARPGITLALWELLCNLLEFFLNWLFLSGLRSGFFLRDGRIMGLSGLFRPLCFPLGLSVESRVLEIVGLEWGLRLIISDFFHSLGFHQPLLRREVESLRPYFPEKQFLSGTDNR